MDIGYTDAREGGAEHSHADVSIGGIGNARRPLANENISCEPTVDVREFIEWYRENQDWYDPLVRNSGDPCGRTSRGPQLMTAFTCTILGTGAAIPTEGRHQTGVLLQRDEPLLVDCGNGVLHRLVEAAVPLEDVDSLLLTHLHLDHVADVPSLLKARLLSGNDGFTIVGPPGTDDLLDHLLAVDGLRDRLSLTVREIEPGDHDVGSIHLTARRTEHSAYCLAYRFDERLTISGDTEATDDVARLADGSSVLLHDCAFPDDHDDPSDHATPTSLGRTLARTGTEVDRLYLTHLYPEAAERADELRETVASFVDAEVHVASDLDQIAVD